MHEKHLYDYAVIRVVPRVEREEFINIGLMLFCKRQRYLRIQYHIPKEKILSFCPDFDIEQLQINIEAFTKICSGKKEGGPIGEFELAERFRWLTAVKSSSIQTSRPHSGFSENLDKTFDRLYTELVL
ncbi:DUF3037 domain-containing protein [Flavobacterium sp. NRK F10]|uniref:DUF3037 domain-containing protein n=1 Tax=Flavobacterium sediminis TaxID=2201181 RepID=A0A2U8QV37_9FLAO|nr:MULTISPECIES: DUF3037 domain-containing protein [Flavobacterium]AWM14028.1 DUF3037 domain-containing protein [Flavobacterium sediminis]MCO6175215.1 DUF3037 domain-containing protein [Flavobacterium sp. NRK F10]